SSKYHGFSCRIGDQPLKVLQYKYKIDDIRIGTLVPSTHRNSPAWKPSTSSTR
ncbi:13237_t:CDS:2, partial [Ambispora gerdemannii]